jgi:glutamate synthase (NADPH/NADH) large chain
MTGGRIVVLGPTGVNFGAGMSGGIAYVWDPHQRFAAGCNLETVGLEHVSNAEDQAELKGLIERHHAFTGSEVADRLLADWDQSLTQFVKVMPSDFKRVLQEQKARQAAALLTQQTASGEPANSR